VRAKKSRAQKITKARRVGAPHSIASRAERGDCALPKLKAKEGLTRFFEIRSNLFKNVHQKGNRVGSGGSAGCARRASENHSRFKETAGQAVGSNLTPLFWG